MKKALKILIGLILVIATISLTFPAMPLQSWGYAALNLIKGGLTLMILLIGTVLIILGISELRD